MPEVLDKQSLKALSAETRQEIVKMLSGRPYTASELAKKLNKHVTTVSEHLSMLEKSKLVEKKEDGHKWIYYTLTPKGEMLTKPRIYSWTVMLALAAIAFVGGLLDLSYYSASRAFSQAAETSGTTVAEPAATPLGMWLIVVAAILVILAFIMKKKGK